MSASPSEEAERGFSLPEPCTLLHRDKLGLNLTFSVLCTCRGPYCMTCDMPIMPLVRAGFKETA